MIWALVIWAGLQGEITAEYSTRERCEIEGQAKAADYSCISTPARAAS